MAFRVYDRKAAGGVKFWWTLVVGTEAGGLTELQTDGHDLECKLHTTGHWWHSPSAQELIDVKCSPDGKWIAAATSTGSCCCWLVAAAAGR